MCDKQLYNCETFGHLIPSDLYSNIRIFGYAKYIFIQASPVEQQATPPIWLTFGHNAQAPEPLSFGPVAVGESEDYEMYIRLSSLLLLLPIPLTKNISLLMVR